MTLTVEESIEKETALADSIPFVDIAVHVNRLPFKLQLAFLCSCYERILPTYMLVDGVDGWGDISILQFILDDLWKCIKKVDIQSEVIADLINKLAEIFIEDDDNEDYGCNLRDGTPYLFIAEGVVKFVECLLKYLQSRNIDDYLEIFVELIYIFREYFSTYMPNIDSKWELEKPFIEKNAFIMNSVLVQNELQKQILDLEILKNINELTPDTILTFRNNACPSEIGILGSLEEVRANIE
jgi:uncharacterized protein YjaG (DUF416 family)